MIPVSQLESLFGGDQVAPGVGTMPPVDRDSPSTYPDAKGRIVYYPGGAAPLDDLNKEVQEAGPGGHMLGGFRKLYKRTRTQRRRRSVRRSTRLKQRKQKNQRSQRRTR